MTQDEIIKMARQAGFTLPEGETWYEAFPQCIEAFAKLVAAAAASKEREACAKICDKLQDDIATEPKHCAEKIRARGQQT